MWLQVVRENWSAGSPGDHNGSNVAFDSSQSDIFVWPVEVSYPSWKRNVKYNFIHPNFAAAAV